jgi:glutamate dehydrogenase
MAASIMVEAANGPTTGEGAAVLASRNIPVIPDVLANAGGVVASYFEWAQDLQGFMWEPELFQQRLEKFMHEAFSHIWNRHKELDLAGCSPDQLRGDPARTSASRWRGR